MKTNSRLIVAIAATLGLQAQGLAASQSGKLTIPVGSQGGAHRADELPAKGLTRSDVQARHGAPQRRATPVGNPPISRWHYPTFTVYFEGDTVIHSVTRHATSNPAD